MKSDSQVFEDLQELGFSDYFINWTFNPQNKINVQHVLSRCEALSQELDEQENFKYTFPAIERLIVRECELYRLGGRKEYPEFAKYFKV